MDSLIIKNKIANWLVLESVRNINVDSPALNRFSGKIQSIRKFKKKLYSSVNLILDQFRTYGTELVFISEKTTRFFENPTTVVYSLASENLSDIKLVNKVDIYCKKEFDLTVPELDHKAYDLKNFIKEYFRISHQQLNNGGRMVLTKPRIYFDYVDQEFKVQIKILSVYPAERPDLAPKPTFNDRVYEKLVDSLRNQRDNIDGKAPTKLEDTDTSRSLEITGESSGFKFFYADPPYCKRIDSIAEELLTDDPCGTKAAKEKEYQDFNKISEDFIKIFEHANGSKVLKLPISGFAGILEDEPLKDE
jgi:hypothetical protein